MRGVLALAQAVATATATPIYLDCEVGAVDNHSSAQIAVDEQGQQVTLSLNGRPGRPLPALFTPDQVKFSSPLGSERIDWVISRVDLTVRQSATFSPRVETGKCRATPVPNKRAF